MRSSSSGITEVIVLVGMLSEKEALLVTAILMPLKAGWFWISEPPAVRGLEDTSRLDEDETGSCELKNPFDELLVVGE
jgi:hypothetical protein